VSFYQEGVAPVHFLAGDSCASIQRVGVLRKGQRRHGRRNFIIGRSPRGNRSNDCPRKPDVIIGP